MQAQVFATFAVREKKSGGGGISVTRRQQVGVYALSRVLRSYPPNLHRAMPAKGVLRLFGKTAARGAAHAPHRFFTVTPACGARHDMVPVQFITHRHAGISHEESALLALRGGCKWVQLRVKGADDAEVEPMARRLREACRKAGATFVVDDRVDLARRVEADGVHLGKEDMPVEEARERLGHGFIIGGTANTIDDIRRLRRAGADYIGCGPLRHTETKERLAPLLGLEGYRRIMEAVRGEGLRIPVCAIGGIEVADVAPLLAAGVDGVAVSGAVLRAADPAAEMRAFLTADGDTL